MPLRAELLRGDSKAELRELAMRAEEATGGAVAYVYTTDSRQAWYRFSGAPMMMTKEEIMTWLHKVVADPDSYC